MTCRPAAISTPPVASWWTASRRYAKATCARSPLRGLVPVGWYISHAQDSLVLRPSDQEILDRHFPEPWQITLVIRPGRDQTLRAATYTRNGSDTEADMFNVLRLGGPGDSDHKNGAIATREPGSNEGSVATAVALAPAAQPVPVLPAAPAAIASAESIISAAPAPPSPPVPAPSTSQVVSVARVAAVETSLATPNGSRPARKVQPAGGLRESATALHGERREAESRPAPAAKMRRTLWAAALAAVSFAVGSASTFYFMRPTAFAGGADTVSLQAGERDGVLMIEWDGGSRPAMMARTGRLEIVDGEKVKSFEMGSAEIRKGAYGVIRRNADVTAKLVLVDSLGKERQEIARYLGKPTAATSRGDVHEATIRQLQDELDALNKRLLWHRRREADLESWADVLESAMKKRGGSPPPRTRTE